MQVMKKAKVFPEVERVTYRLENDTCLHCGGPIECCHAVWRKHIITLAGVLFVSNLGFRCTNPDCPHPGVVWRSAIADAMALKGFSYGLDVVVHVGVLQLTHHYTREQIHRGMIERGIDVSEREIQYLYEAYMRLLKYTNPQKIAGLAPEIEKNGGMLISIDGVQSERGNETLWVVREALTNCALCAEVLMSSDAGSIKRLLKPVVESGYPILGVISDAQSSIRAAVSELLPGVPHQYCQFHYLKDIAAPAVAEDGKLKTSIKNHLDEGRSIHAQHQELHRRCRPPELPGRNPRIQEVNRYPRPVQR
ncbi:MAG: transposase [Firmicutes bacterium]|nr:transposase [Bacillota bacterium]